MVEQEFKIIKNSFKFKPWLKILMKIMIGIRIRILLTRLNASIYKSKDNHV